MQQVHSGSLRILPSVHQTISWPFLHHQNTKYYKKKNFKGGRGKKYCIFMKVATGLLPLDSEYY